MSARSPPSRVLAPLGPRSAGLMPLTTAPRTPLATHAQMKPSSTSSSRRRGPDSSQTATRERPLTRGAPRARRRRARAHPRPPVRPGDGQAPQHRAARGGRQPSGRCATHSTTSSAGAGPTTRRRRGHSNPAAGSTSTLRTPRVGLAVEADPRELMRDYLVQGVGTGPGSGAARLRRSGWPSSTGSTTRGLCWRS